VLWLPAWDCLADKSWMDFRKISWMVLIRISSASELSGNSLGNLKTLYAETSPAQLSTEGQQNSKFSNVGSVENNIFFIV